MAEVSGLTHALEFCMASVHRWSFRLRWEATRCDVVYSNLSRNPDFHLRPDGYLALEEERRKAGRQAHCDIGTRVGPSGGLSLHRPADEVEEGVRPSVRCPRYGRRTDLSNQVVVWSLLSYNECLRTVPVHSGLAAELFCGDLE